MKRNYVNRALFNLYNAAVTCFTATKLFLIRTTTILSQFLHYISLISTFDTVKLMLF